MKLSEKCESCFSYMSGTCSECYDSIEECEDEEGYVNVDEYRKNSKSEFKSFAAMDKYMEEGI